MVEVELGTHSNGTLTQAPAAERTEGNLKFSPGMVSEASLTIELALRQRFGNPAWQTRNYNRLMQEATQAAPKPLSILTTVTLEAQELSMPRSAATPLKLAP